MLYQLSCIRENLKIETRKCLLEDIGFKWQS